MQNFGRIKNTFNHLLVEGITNKTNENKAIFKKFMKAIKESRILKTQFNVYYDIEKKTEPNEMKSAEFVRESISLMNQFSKEDILAENKKLVDILEKHNITIDDNDYPNYELHENINNLILTKRNSKNVNSIVESLGKVINHIKENIVEDKKIRNNDIMPNSFVGNLMVEKFNERYSELTDKERNVIKRIIESDSTGKKALLQELTTECIDLVNSRLGESNDVTEKEALLNVKEVLLTLEYTEDTFINNVGKIIELKKAFDV